MQNTNEFIPVLQQFFCQNILYVLSWLGVLLYIHRLTNRERRTAILIILAFVILIFNPIIFKFIALKLNYSAEYYRFFWIIPYHMTLAYLIYTAMQQVEKMNIRFIYICIAAVGSILISVDMENLKLPHNSYQIPNETIEVAETLKQLAQNEDTEITVLADNTINNTIRQYDAHIRLPFNKYTQGGVDAETNTETIEGVASMLMYNRDNLSANAIREIMSERSIDYLVISIYNTTSLSYMQKLHWQIVSTTSAYHILQYQEPVFDAAPLKAAGLETEAVEVVIPGLSEEYHFLLLADLHIITENNEVSSKDLQTVLSRQHWSSVSEGTTAAEYWGNLPEILDSCNADALLLGGDMIDFCSTSNIECLEEGLDKLDTPYVYVRADHDSCPFYCDGLTEKDCHALHASIDGNEEIWCTEFPEFYIVGLSGNTGQISRSGLARIKEIFTAGKPVILLAHVPYDSMLDPSLGEASKEAWQDRALIWGENCYYQPDANTKEFMNMIYAEDSPVKEILCGHLHFTWDGNLTDNTHEHVFSPAFEKKVGVITVKGK